MMSALSPSVQLRNLRARYGGMLTLSLIAEPLVRIRYLKEYAITARKRRDVYHTDDHRYDWGDTEYREALADLFAEVARIRRGRFAERVAA